MAPKTYFLSDAHTTSPGDGAIHDAALAMLGDAGWISVRDPNEANCVIIGGGGTLYGRHEEQRYGDSLQHSLHTIRAATCLNNGGSVCVFGSGCQGFECTNDHKEVWKELLHSCSVISLRDKGSVEWLCEDLGLDADDTRFAVHGDLSFFWDPGENKKKPEKRIVIGVNVKGLNAQENTVLLDSLRSIHDMGYELIWYPFEKNGLQECIDAAHLVGATVCASVDGGCFSDWNRYMHTIRSSAASISNRLHGLLMGVMSRRPVVPIINARKVECQEKHLFNGDAPFRVGGDFQSEEALSALLQALESHEAIDVLYDKIAKSEKETINGHICELTKAFD